MVVGNPATEGVRMGPLATAGQKTAVLEGISLLARDGRLVHSRPGLKPEGVPEGKGFFVSPTLLEVEPGAEAPSVHSHEVFGPVATIVPYDGTAAQARGAHRARRGRPGLVHLLRGRAVRLRSRPSASLRFTADSSSAARRSPRLSPGPGTVLPQLVHGGPGRAGNGEELGGERGLAFYMQRTAIEGSRPVIERILKQGGQ